VRGQEDTRDAQFQERAKGSDALFRNSFCYGCRAAEHGEVGEDCAARQARANAGVDWCGCRGGEERDAPVEATSHADLVMGLHIGATRRLDNRSTVRSQSLSRTDRANRAKHATEWHRALDAVTK